MEGSDMYSNEIIMFNVCKYTYTYVCNDDIVRPTDRQTEP